MLNIDQIQSDISSLVQQLNVKEIKVDEKDFQELKRKFARVVGLDMDFDHLAEIHLYGVRIYT